MCALSQRSSRACTLSRGAPVRCSSAMMRTRGLSASSAATSLPTGWPSQRMMPSVASTNCSSAACASLAARASISPASAFCAAPASAFASEPAADASGVKVKPSSRPMAWPSTTTSPVLPMSVSSTVFSRIRRISTLVRRSTKRSVSRSCKRVGQLVLDRARHALPVLGIGEPVGPVGGKGPGADMGDAVRQRVDVAIGHDRPARPAWRTSRWESYPSRIRKPYSVIASSAWVAGEILR